MSELKHMHAKTECLPFNTEDVRLIITERYGKQEIRMHGEDARFIVEAIAAAKRRTQPKAAKATGTAGEQDALREQWARVDAEIGGKAMHVAAFDDGVNVSRVARQPAPVVAVKTWQERVKRTDDATAMQRRSIVARDEEIAGLRAALAATAAPVVDIEQLIGIIRSFGYTTYSQSREIAEALTARSQP